MRVITGKRILYDFRLSFYLDLYTTQGYSIFIVGNEGGVKKLDSNQETPVSTHHHSYSKIKPDLLKRLRRIEGQVRGIQKMIEEDRYCVDILVQISAIKNALQNVAFPLLEVHTKGCVVDAIANKEGEQEKVDELLEVYRQFSKM